MPAPMRFTNYAMRDIENGEPPTTRLERLVADIRAKVMPEAEIDG